MLNFEFYNPTKVIFGRGAEMTAGKEIKALGGHKVLVHFGGSHLKKSGVLDRIHESLTEAGLTYVDLGGVVPNPRLGLVKEGIRLCKEEGVDFLLPVGGGSVIDSAKGIGYGLVNDFPLEDLLLGKVTTDKIAPLGCISTIAAAGSETSNSMVITIEEGMLKRSYNHDCARPKFAIMNPELTCTLPAYQTASGASDIMMHTMERYFTNGGNMELTDAIAEGLMRTVMEQAIILRDDPQNYNARAEVMWASSLSHNGLTGCGTDGGDFATHGLEHEMGGMFDVAHGAGLAAIWGSWARYVLESCTPRFARFARKVMGIADGGTEREAALQGIAAMEEFFRSIEMPTNMKELGIAPSEEELRTMAHMCSAAAGGEKGSAKVLEERDMLEIYRMALGE